MGGAALGGGTDDATDGATLDATDGGFTATGGDSSGAANAPALRAMAGDLGSGVGGCGDARPADAAAWPGDGGKPGTAGLGAASAGAARTDVCDDAHDVSARGGKWPGAAPRACDADGAALYVPGA